MFSVANTVELCVSVELSQWQDTDLMKKLKKVWVMGLLFDNNFHSLMCLICVAEEFGKEELDGFQNHLGTMPTAFWYLALNSFLIDVTK